MMRGRLVDEWKRREAALPAVQKIRVDYEPYFYGALHSVAAYCGMRKPFGTEIKSWKHGITEDELVRHPRQLAQYCGPAEVHLVARPRHAELLGQFGYLRTEVVGMPFAYIVSTGAQRLPKSLLILPAHSTAHSAAGEDEMNYLRSIRPLLESFDLVVFCIHQACVARGVWTRSLDLLGLPWVEGAGIDDAATMVRLRTLFDTFECVSANSLVSGLAYAAASGCRISLHEPFSGPRRESLVNEPFYVANPDLLEPAVVNGSFEAVRARLEWMPVLPSDSVKAQAWGEEMIGSAWRKSPAEMRRILGWTIPRRLARCLRKLSAK